MLPGSRGSTPGISAGLFNASLFNADLLNLSVIFQIANQGGK